MNLLNIVEIIISLIACLGGYELIKYLLNLKSEKKKAKAEAAKVELEVHKQLQDLTINKNDETIEHWAKLSTQYQHDVEYYRSLLQERDLKIVEKESALSEKDELIASLRAQINDLTSENTALTLTRCDKLQCIDRQPPFGFTRIDIQNGKILEA